MSDVKVGSWSTAESPFTIEYSLVVIEEIRHEVAEGFQRLSRGGIEVGGILYGTHEGGVVRVMAMRPIACEHARGPAFLLSDKDRMALNEQLVQDKDDPHLEGLISVGWFLSHTRSEVTLSESDLEIYSIFFPAPWQVTLVVRPGRGGSMRAGFFVREADGTVKCENSYQEFNFPDRLAGVLDRTPDRPRERGFQRGYSERAFSRGENRGEQRGEHRGDVAERIIQRAEPATAAARLPREMAAVPQVAAPTFLPAERPRRKWPWLVAWAVIVIVAAVFGLRYWMMHSVSEPISLSVVERDGQLQIEWNHLAKPVTNASRGSLVIVDGADSRTFALTPQILAAGKFTYVRKSGDIEVRMTVENADGGSVQEASRFLGRPPVAPAASSDELIALQQRKDALEAEVRRLRRENDAQAARIQQLDRTLQVLKTRLGIVEGKQ